MRFFQKIFCQILTEIDNYYQSKRQVFGAVYRNEHEEIFTR